MIKRGDNVFRKLFFCCFASALAACLLLCGCNNKSAQNTDDLPTLTIGSDIYKPYFYMDDVYVGIDIDIATQACKRIGMKAVFKQIQWQDKDEYLKSGEVECLWGSFSMNGREDKYNWAGPYMHSRQVVIVPKSSDIYKLSDLNGKNIAVQNSSKPEELFLNHKVKEVKNIKNVYSFSNISKVFSALKNGYVDACAGHENAYKSYMKQQIADYRILNEPLLTADLGVAFYKDNHSQYIQKLSKALAEMRKDGTIAEILKSYGIDSEKALEEVSE